VPDFYPPVDLGRSGMLEVGDGQLVYWEESGNPDGKPVVFLHGGPGGRVAPAQRRHFDPDAYRIVLFDQRGCGRSTPGVHEDGVGLTANTTWHLVADMECLREHLGIDRWQLFGGSWGATLALAYAQRHPERVTEIVLRGVFTSTEAELDWLYRGGAGTIHPDAWNAFLAPVPEAARADPFAAYRALIDDPDPDVRTGAALAWSTWEAALCELIPTTGLVEQYADPEFAVPFTRLALHYFGHRSWLADDQLVAEAGKLAGIPGVIVQGRYDMVCPPVSAWRLHQAWPDSELVMLPVAGHAVGERGVLAALTAATDRFRPAPH
jgi:proline iminopeptidase